MSVMQADVELSKVCATVSFSLLKTDKSIEAKARQELTGSVFIHELLSRHHPKPSRRTRDSPRREAGSLLEAP